MGHHAQHLSGRRTSGVLGRPSSRLGRVAAAAMAGSIGLVILLNVIAEQGSGEDSKQGGLFVAAVLCLAVSGVVGLVAVLRRRERSWVVVLPTALISLAIINELIQGLVALVGGGGE